MEEKNFYNDLDRTLLIIKSAQEKKEKERREKKRRERERERKKEIRRKKKKLEKFIKFYFLSRIIL